MSARERILMIRLLVKILDNPKYAEVLGIEGKIKEVNARRHEPKQCRFKTSQKM